MKYLIAICTIILTGCTQPFIGVPGGKLSGSDATPPGSWGAVPDVVQMETRPDDPYSVNIWAVSKDNHLYVGTQDATWVPFIQQDPRVKIKIDERLYSLTALEVKDPAEIDRVISVYSSKYDFDASEVGNNGQLFRLERN